MEILEGEIVDCRVQEFYESFHSPDLFIATLSRKLYQIKIGNKDITAVSFADSPDIPKGTKVIIEERGRIIKEYFLKIDNQEIPVFYLL